ncbi:alpha/beta fold hydrolase [Roseomonas sp. WA12]
MRRGVLHFRRFGQGGTSLVFVHGVLCSSEDWRLQWEVLQEHHDVIACDLPAHGATPGTVEDCSVERFGGDVSTLLVDLNLSDVVLVGHSLGCRVVLDAARRERRRVRGLVLIDGSRIAVGDPAVAEANVAAMIGRVGPASFVRMMFAQMFVARGTDQQKILSRALSMPDDIAVALWPRMARWDAAALEDALSAVRVPLLAVQSTRRTLELERIPLEHEETTEWLELVMRTVPTAEVRTLPGIGHFAQIEASAEVNNMLAQFCADLPAKRQKLR